MILDSGICTVFQAVDASARGDMPRPGYIPIWASWYGVLSFETVPVRPTEGRREMRTDKRIRILQCDKIRQNDVVVLDHVETMADVAPGTPIYRVNRAYHGVDEDGPTQISDLSLEVIDP